MMKLKRLRASIIAASIALSALIRQGQRANLFSSPLDGLNQVFAPAAIGSFFDISGHISPLEYNDILRQRWWKIEKK
jgi:hypothetical protein